MSQFTLEEHLQQDADFHTPLERVNFEAGMLLGIDATRAEQAYHRLRINRHNYWFHGAGTLVGFAVKLDPPEGTEPEELPDELPEPGELPEPSEEADNISVRLIVTPGIGIDGLGREVMSFEPYCVNLRDWLTAQLEQPDGNQLLSDGFIEGDTVLSLLITMRYHACATGLQPVLARKINAGTDPVQPSRARDSVLLEIIPGPTPTATENPWRGLNLETVDPETDLTPTETAFKEAAGEAEEKFYDDKSRLIYAVPASNRALEIDGDIEDLSRTLLAQVRVPLTADLQPDIDPARITVNNLVRPFVSTANQLAWLSRQEPTS